VEVDRKQLKLRAIKFKDACEFVAKHHRHVPPSRVWKFGTSVVLGDEVVGVVMVGPPIAPRFNDGLTLEVLRCCSDGTPHVPSMLLATAWKAARALGYYRMITYTREHESGASLRATGFTEVKSSPIDSWPKAPRRIVEGLYKDLKGGKTLWEIRDEEQ